MDITYFHIIVLHFMYTNTYVYVYISAYMNIGTNINIDVIGKYINKTGRYVANDVFQNSNNYHVSNSSC